MDKLEYFKLALKHKLFLDTNWILKTFSITKDSKIVDIEYDLIVQPWGFTVNDADQTRIPHDVTTPLLKFDERITLTSKDLININEDVDTSIGTALFNAICLVNPFKDKISYINGNIDLSKIDSIITKKLVSNEISETLEVIVTDTKDIQVSEIFDYIDALEYIGMFSQLTSPVITRKTITAPPGIDEFKSKLLKRYEGKLDDPVENVKFEDELLAFDDEYLKDDPTYGKFLSGKIKNVARKKQFLTIGSEQSFEIGVTSKPIVNSLAEGWPKDPQDLVSINDGIRVGSYSRGVETIKGGVSAKYLLRAGNSFQIANVDCGTKFGLYRNYSESTKEKLINRYIIMGEKVILVSEKDVHKYLNKSIIVRSPAFCISENDFICKICAGNNLNRFSKGLTIPLTEISSIILTAALKKMHGSKLSNVRLDIDKVLS